MRKRKVERMKMMEGVEWKEGKKERLSRVRIREGTKKVNAR